MFDKAPEGLEALQYTPQKAKKMIERAQRNRRRYKKFKANQRSWAIKARKKHEQQMQSLEYQERLGRQIKETL